MGLRYLGVSKGDEILLPELVCDVLMVPLANLGVKARFYKVGPGLKPDLGSAAENINDKTAAFMAVHYFGFPQDTREIAEFCGQNDLWFVEDCAHSFLTSVDGRQIGSSGDIALYSYRKLVPVVNGGALIINRPIHPEKIAELENTAELLPGESAGLARFRYFLHRVESRYEVPLSRILRKKGTPLAQPPGSTEGEQKNYSMDAASFKILQSYSYRHEYERRRERYRHWAAETEALGLSPVFGNLPDNVAPMGFPVWVDRLEYWLSYFGERRIKAYQWPTLPRYVAEHCPETVKMANSLLVIGI